MTKKSVWPGYNTQYSQRTELCYSCVKVTSRSIRWQWNITISYSLWNTNMLFLSLTNPISKKDLIRKLECYFTKHFKTTLFYWLHQKTNRFLLSQIEMLIFSVTPHSWQAFHTVPSHVWTHVNFFNYVNLQF